MVGCTSPCLGNYRLLHLLCKGTIADVYLGKHIYLKTEAAIKVLHVMLHEEAIEHFREEARQLRLLEHPHIIHVRDMDIEDRIPFLIMEYAPGGTVRERHPQGIPLPLPTILAYTQQIASALDYAHAQNLIHLDLKPENLLLDQNGNILLSDFGETLLMRHVDEMDKQSIGGTLAYTAPEQIHGKPCPASDQYVLALLVYEWLSGRRPFSGSAAELCGQHLFASPPLLAAQIPSLPPAIDLVLGKALAKSAEARFATVSDFVAMLERAMRGERVSIPSEVVCDEPSLVAEVSPQVEGTCRCWLNLPALKLSSPVVARIGQENELVPASIHLTRRESEVLALLAQGLSNGQIAEKLVLSVVTVNSYLRSIYSKLGVSSRTGAVRYALDHHLV